MGRVVHERILAGRYQLQEALGEGAFGQVWQALDAEESRTVAVKVIRVGEIVNPEFATDIAERFQREVDAVSVLRHPNIVRAFEAGRSGDDLFLAMELADGGALADILDARYAAGLGPVRVADVVAVAAQTCEGLAAAHAASIVHRDIKPSNLMVCSDGLIKIIDFGMARLLDDGSPRLTRQGTAVGTLAYMSPEQLEGGDADGRADLYSLGCVMYELLAGRRPFLADEPEAMLMQQLYDTPPPLRSFRPAIPADLARLTEAMLAKEPEDRPAGADEVLRRLAAIGTMTPPADLAAALRTSGDPASVTPVPGAHPSTQLADFNSLPTQAVATAHPPTQLVGVTQPATETVPVRPLKLPASQLSPSQPPASQEAEATSAPGREDPGSDGETPVRFGPGVAAAAPDPPAPQEPAKARRSLWRRSR
jgi:eukaryotic-like serine/threonine-protein kinase